MNLDNQNIKGNALFTSIEVPVLDEIENIAKISDRIYATGRRKHASARLWLSNGTGFEINKKSLKEYFLEDSLVYEILSPLACVEKQYGPVIVKFFATVKGSGIVSQALAVRLALARTLVEYDIKFKEVLKKAGYLTRDSRKKEREHYGFRTSRKPQQYKRR